MYELVYEDDIVCISHIRMNTQIFVKLCGMLRTLGQLADTKNVKVEEMVAMFLYIIAHHNKNRVVMREFKRSGETISRCFNKVLNGVCLLQKYLLKIPEAVSENSNDVRWRCFKNCLGALDGTYIRIKVPTADKPRYRTRKADIATNMLGVCSHDMQFIYVLPGWEGSAQDSRILRDAISRQHDLKVPDGCYYLVDAGYPNAKGFLAPYRGTRYHLNEWRVGHQPTSPEEYFNMKHSRARNVIERCFGLLKIRWTILRSLSWYLVQTHNKIIIACCLLHNFIRQEMSVDPGESLPGYNPNYSEPEGPPLTFVETSNEWAQFRVNLANEMYNAWRA